MKIKLTESQYKLIKEQGIKTPSGDIIGPGGISHEENIKTVQNASVSGTKVLDGLQFVLDWAGLVPIYGDALDFVNAIIYFLRNKKLEGILSVIAIIPVVGSVIALPLKLIFKAIPPKWIVKIAEFITKGGKGAAAAITEGFIKIAGEKAPKEMETVLSTLNKNMGVISPILDKLNKPFAYLEKFNSKWIPDAYEKLVHKGATKGSEVVKGIKKWLFGMSDSVEAKTITEAQKLYKKSFIDAMSPEEWQSQVKKLLSGDGDKATRKKEFIETVSNPKKPKVKATGGITIPADEIHVIEAVLKSKGTTKSWGLDQTGEYNSIPLTVKINGKIEHVKFAVHDRQIIPWIDGDKFKNWEGYNKAMQKWIAAGKPDDGMVDIVKKMNMPHKYWQTRPIEDGTDAVVLHNLINNVGGDVDKFIILKPTGKTISIEDLEWNLEHELSHVYQRSQYSPKLKDTYKIPGTLNSYADAIHQLNKKSIVVDKLGKIKYGKINRDINKQWDGVPPPPLEKSLYSIKEKADAMRQAIKKGDFSLDAKWLTYTDKELIKRVEKLAHAGNKDMQNIIFKSANNLMYWMHRWEVEAQLNALLKTIRNKGQQKEYQGFITWLENYLRTSGKGSAESIETIISKSNKLGLSKQFLLTLEMLDNMKSVYPQTTKQVYGELYKQIQNMKKAGFSESFKRNIKIKLTESQYKKVLLREFGEVVRDPKEWYLRVLEWVDSPQELDFETDEIEVVVHDKKGSYLGYYDKDQNLGFVVTEYGIGLEDEEENIEEQEEGGESSGGGSMSKWDDLVSPVRGPANTLDNSPWSVSPQRGPANTLDNSPWSVSPVRGPANTLT